MKRMLIVMLVFALTLIPLGASVNAQEDGEIPVPIKKNAEGGKGSKISPALEQLSEDYQSYVGLNSGDDQGFRSSDSFMPVANGWVTIDAVASGDTNTLRADLEKAGLRNGASFGRMVSGQLPIAALDGLQNTDSLNSLRPAYVTTNAGLVTSQGDPAMRSDAARSRFGLDGAGVRVGTLSDSYDCRSPGAAAGDVASGDLPAGVVVLSELSSCPGGIDEGRAMMQLIHDVAPGSTQAFHTAFNGIADFAQGIIDLQQTAGSNVIVDDVIYFGEPMFQDGVVARAVDTVVAGGASYFSSAGNNGRDAYESAFVPSGQTPVGGDNGEAHNFGEGDVFQRFTLLPGGQVIFVFQWDQPIKDATTGSPGSASDLDIWIMNDPPTGVVEDGNGCTLTNIGSDPLEICSIGNSESVPLNLNLVITNFSGVNPGLMKVVRFEGGAGVSAIEHDTNSGTIFGHACAAGAEAMGAADYRRTPAFGTNPPVLESFSSAGPCPILFDANGTRKVAPEVRQKPEIVAPDGTNTTFFGGSDPEGDSFPNFFGTSAAAPHAAAGAALIKQAFPSSSGPSIYSSMEATAINMNGPGFDLDTGFGLVQIDLALLNMDATAPQTSITSFSPDPDTNPSPTFMFDGTDNLSQPANLTFQCQIDGLGFAPCTSSHMVGPLIDGSHTFDVRATDEAGNTDASPATHAWTLDTTPNNTTVEFVPTPQNIPAAGTASVDVVVRKVTDPDGLGAYDITFTYDQTVVTVDSVSGGDAPFDGAPTCNINNTIGRVICNAVQATPVPGPTGDINIYDVAFTAVGSPGATSDLVFTAINLTDVNTNPISAAGVDGRLNISPVLAAAPSLDLFQDPADGATGVKIDVTRVFDPVSDLDALVKLGGFQSKLTYDGDCINIMDVRAMDFPITAKNIDNPGGMTTFNGVEAAGVAWPADLGHALTRLVGSNQVLCTLRNEISSLIDENGQPINVSADLSRQFQRGDARADGNISIADALFIAQYLVGSRPACTTVVDLNCLHSVNAASVRHDEGFDKKTIADALFIAQSLVGLRDESYNLVVQ